MLKKIIGAGLLLATAAAAQAASTGWTVTGTIVPPPCNLTLSGGGVAAFGTIAGTVVQGWPKLSGPARYSGIDAKVMKSLNLAVNCPNLATFALYFQDNKAATLAGPAGQAYSFGLGTYTPPGRAATNLGRYVVAYDKFVIKATSAGGSIPPRMKLLADGTATASSSWKQATLNDAIYLPSGKSLGFVSGVLSTKPDALLSAGGPIDFYFEPLQDVVDSATSDITLDGSVTVTLILL